MAAEATRGQGEQPAVVTKALSRIGDIATLPEVTVKIIEIVENPKSTARDLHDVIKNDPALSVKVLKVVNSAFYGLPGQVASVDRAIILLGGALVTPVVAAFAISAPIVEYLNTSTLFLGSIVIGNGINPNNRLFTILAIRLG